MQTFSKVSSIVANIQTTLTHTGDRRNKFFSFKAVIDFYGPAELILLPSVQHHYHVLILPRAASPVTYIDKNDPPFLIIHGGKDEVVSNKHSHLLSSWLNVLGVENELALVKDSPHFGVIFDSDEVRNKVMIFLKQQMN